MGKLIQGNFGKKTTGNKEKIVVSRKYRAAGFIGEHVGACPKCGSDMVLVDFRHDGTMGYCLCETPELTCLHKCLVPLIDRHTPEGLHEAKCLMQERLELTDDQWDVFTAGITDRDIARRAKRSR